MDYESMLKEKETELISWQGKLKEVEQSPTKTIEVWENGYTSRNVYNKKMVESRIERIEREINTLKNEIKKSSAEKDWEVKRTIEERNPQKIERPSLQNNIDIQTTNTANLNSNKAIDARKDAQQRFFAMSKTKQAMAKLTGKYGKFKKLWNKASDPLSRQEQEQVAAELDSMFKGKSK